MDLINYRRLCGSCRKRRCQEGRWLRGIVMWCGILSCLIFLSFIKFSGHRAPSARMRCVIVWRWGESVNVPMTMSGCALQYTAFIPTIPGSRASPSPALLIDALVLVHGHAGHAGMRISHLPSAKCSHFHQHDARGRTQQTRSQFIESVIGKVRIMCEEEHRICSIQQGATRSSISARSSAGRVLRNGDLVSDTRQDVSFTGSSCRMCVLLS